MNEKLEEKLKEAGREINLHGNRVSFTISGAPLEVHAKFTENAEKYYGDCYWCYLQALLKKEELYEMMVKIVEYLLGDIEEPSEEKKENAKKEIKTLGGAKHE